MSRIQRVALATSLLADLPALQPRTARAALKLVAANPEQTISAIETQLDYTIAEACLNRFSRLEDIAEKLGFWTSLGYRVALEEDPAYPAAWREKLGATAPLAAFIWGDGNALKGPLIGVVGSRKATEGLILTTRSVAAALSNEGYGIVSGGAKGVDGAALGAASRCVHILAGQMEQTRRQLPPFSSGRDLLISPYRPDAGFTVGQAMGRNKLIYAMAEATIVMACEEGSGGSWEGAVEALKKGYGTVLVWSGEGALSGNAALEKLGAKPVASKESLISEIKIVPAQNLFS